MFAIRHVSAVDGRTHEFIVLQVAPVGLADFSRHLAGGKSTFHLRAKVRIHASPDLPVGSERTLDLTIVFNQKLKHYALVPGGVLPPDYLLRGGTRLLMDRNVVSELQGMPAADTGAPHRLRWLNSEGFHVNPILGVIEGSKRRTQTFGEFDYEYIKAEKLVRRRLPLAKVVEFSGSARRLMFDMHRQFAPRAARESQFLHAIADRLCEQVATSNLRKTEEFILQAADQAGLRRLTAIVLTALAKLYEGHEGSPAAKLLKLKELRDAGSDWAGCAYNVVADVRQMEVMSTGITMPDLATALTGDVGLAQVWCGLRPTVDKRDDGTIGFQCRPDPELFPRLEGRIDDLVMRITSSGSAATGG